VIDRDSDQNVAGLQVVTQQADYWNEFSEIAGREGVEHNNRKKTEEEED
jgi:hypothetical protein